MLIGCMVLAQVSAEVLAPSPAGARLEIREGPPVVAQCPKYGWEFPLAFEGWAGLGGEPELRFRVYAQSQKAAPIAKSATRMLLRIWEMSKVRIRFDHPLMYYSLVEVFLCDGGEAGGEQGTFHYPNGRATNGIYIYHLDSFKDPVERAREIAHEYGHAILPNTRGFESPEEFGNGYLGEKLFLFWLADSVSRGQLTTEDTMGAELSSWVARHAKPLADAVWLNGPDEAALASKGQRALDAFIGLHLYYWEAFPGALGRGMKLVGGPRASDLLKGLLFAVDELGDWEVYVPERFRGKEIWLPVAGWKVGGGSVVGRKGAWAKVRPGTGKLEVRKPD